MKQGDRPHSCFNSLVLKTGLPCSCLAKLAPITSGKTAGISGKRNQISNSGMDQCSLVAFLCGDWNWCPQHGVGAALCLGAELNSNPLCRLGGHCVFTVWHGHLLTTVVTYSDTCFQTLKHWGFNRNMKVAVQGETEASSSWLNRPLHMKANLQLLAVFTNVRSSVA